MKIKSFFTGMATGSLGGLIGLGGAEFRLPILVGVLNIDSFHAVLINICISLVTVIFALIFRDSFADVLLYKDIILNLLIGTLTGAFLGASVASKINKKALNRAIFYLLVFLSIILFSHAFFTFESSFDIPYLVKSIAGVILGVAIGMISSMLGVAGGELLIPTIILLFGIDIKTAGTLSLAISLPTLCVAIYKYNKNHRLKEIFVFKDILIFMALGSILGAFIGALAFGIIDVTLLEVTLAFILLISAYKIFNKGKQHEK